MTSLLSKWMSRENKSKGWQAIRFIEYFSITPKQYRQMLSILTDVVESKMCENNWSEINYNHVPSVASKNYRKAFGRHDGERYGEWLSALEKGSPEVKINAGAIFPNDVIKPYLNSGRGGSITVDRTIEAQWKALPDFVTEGLSFVPVVDTSGSMHGDIAWEVAYSLGVYLAERNKSVFKDAFITFSRIAKLIPLGNGTLRDKVNVLLRHEIVENTNIESVFKLILDKSVKAKLSQEDMPTHVIILSDMQFDPSRFDANENSLEMIKRMYKKAGYEMPQIIYWNLRSSNGIPVKFDESGVALVSGFSPSLMKSVLNGSTTPMNMMLSVLDSERYAVIEERLS